LKFPDKIPELPHRSKKWGTFCAVSFEIHSLFGAINFIAAPANFFCSALRV
jgi:hypothetical protein